MIHGINIPDTIIYIRDLNHIRIDIERHLLLEFQLASIFFFKYHLSFRIHCTHISLICRCRCLIRTAIEDDQIRILCHLHEQRFHIFQIYIKGSCIHSRDDLCHEPSLWHIHFPQIVQSPHTVVLYNDLSRLILLLTLCQEHFIKFRLILQNHQRGVGLLKKFVFVLFDSFFAGNDQVAFAAGEIIIRQSLLHKPGLAALQKSVYDKYRDLCHCYLPHYSVRPNTFASSSSFRWEPITHRRPV